MGPGITWYDVLGVLPGAETERIRTEYDAKAAVLRPDLISGAPSDVLEAASRAQDMLDTAWQVLGDPASRVRYDESVGLRQSGGGLGQPGTGSIPTDWMGPDMKKILDRLDATGGMGGMQWPHRAKRVAVPDVRGLFYNLGLEVAARANLRVTTVRLTPHPMPVEGLVVDQSPRAPAKLPPHGELTIQVWHPPARP